MKNPNRTAGKRRAESGENVRPDTIAVVSGKYGSCVQYAKWLIEETGCDAIEYSKQQLGYVSLYKNIVYIGAVNEGDVSKVNILWQNYNNFGLDGRKIIVCAVGIGDPENESYIKKIMHKSGSDQGYCSFYLLPGKVDRSSMRALDRSMFDKFIASIDMIYEKDAANVIVRRAMQGYDGVARSALAPVVEEIMSTR